ncbi:Keratin, type I cytoskeletal 20 Cytokeratin-20 [Channa argus]|uniref:Keratin, type I cytoskeletal 20 Cytokeratin-20 n=1 Tax=Channa argus TaxID=215402 RepID=A0A6G1PB94_CHAAH|nr:Keratin, type I cytoskeletal 20 Cytokeratin-20 [Channa argus]
MLHPHALAPSFTKIREWYQSRTVISRDYTSYFATINELKDKIRIASKLNAKTVLDTDNARLAAEDFKMKLLQWNRK